MFVGLVDPVFQGPGIWFLVLFGIVIHHVFWTGPGPLFYVVWCHPQVFGNIVWTSGPGIIRALGLYFVIVGLVDLVFRDPGILFFGFVCHPKNLYHVWSDIENHAQEPGRPKRDMPPIALPKAPIASWLFRRDTLLIHNPKTCNRQDYKILFNTWPGLILLTHPKVGNNSIFALQGVKAGLFLIPVPWLNRNVLSEPISWTKDPSKPFKWASRAVPVSCLLCCEVFLFF